MAHLGADSIRVNCKGRYTVDFFDSYVLFSLNNLLHLLLVGIPEHN